MQAAILGAGPAGVLHALSFRAHRVPVRKIFDPDRQRAAALAAICDAEVAGDLDEIASSDLECVSICSPPRVHVEQAERCERPGRTLFVEKPVAVTKHELARLLRIPSCIGVLQWRAGRAIRVLRRAIAEGLLGPRPSVCVDLAMHRARDYFTGERSTDTRWGCGALLSVGIHAIDAVCHALDRPVVRVSAALSKDSEIERMAVVLATFAGGSLATFRCTFDGAAPDDVRLVFAGGGVTASIVGTEVDPTAASVRWRSSDARTLAQLKAMERETAGRVDAPLIVPFLGDALAAIEAGKTPGSCVELPSISNVQAAHDLALMAYACDERA